MEPPKIQVRLESKGPELTKTLSLPSKIGRRIGNKSVPSETNGIFESQVLSRNHAEIFLENGKVYLKDPESSNGTYLAGEKVTKPVELYDGAEVDFGVVVYDEDGETVKHDKVSVVVRLIEKDPEAEVLPEVVVRSLPPNFNLKSEETQELLFQSLLSTLLDASQRQTEVELTLQELNEVLDSGDLQFKGPENQVSGETIKLQREMRVLKKKATDFDAKAAQLQVVETENVALKTQVEELTAKLQQQKTEGETTQPLAEKVASLEKALQEKQVFLQREEKRREANEKAQAAQKERISSLEASLEKAEAACKRLETEGKEQSENDKRIQELESQLAEFKEKHAAALVEATRAQARVTLLEYELELSKDTIQHARSHPMSPDHPPLPSTRSMPHLPISLEKKVQSPKGAGNVSSKIRNIQLIFEKNEQPVS